MNLKLILSLLTALPQLFSIVDATVQSVETALGDATGSTKLAAASAKVNSVLNSVGADVALVSNVQGVLTPMINASVAMFNAAGVFKKPAAANAQTAAGAAAA